MDNHSSLALTRTFKKSSLYRMIARLLGQRDPFIAQYKPIAYSQGNQRAFLLPLPRRVAVILFDEEFVLKERHLRIDESFKTETSLHSRGLSYAHYSEHYQCARTQETQSVHAYFNLHGQYLYSLARQNDEAVDLAPTIEAGLQTNAQAALSILTELSDKQHRLLSDGVTEADMHERTLLQLSYHIQNDEASRKSYLNVAKKFIQAVDSINQLQDSVVDYRGRVIRSHIDYLNALGIGVRQESPREADEVEAPDAGQVDASPTSPPLMQARDLSNAVAIEKIDVLRVALAEIDKRHTTLAQRHIASRDIATELKRKILNTVYLTDLTPKELASIKSAERALQKLLPLEELLIKTFSSNETVEFLAILDHDKSFITERLIKPLSEICCEERDPSRMSTQVEMLDALMNQSEIFNNQYRTFCKYIHMQENFNEFSCSQMIHSLSRNNYPYAEFLLRHDATDAYHAIIYKDHALPVAVYLTCMEADPKYYELLLKYKIDLHAPIIKRDAPRVNRVWMSEKHMPNRAKTKYRRNILTRNSNDYNSHYVFDIALKTQSLLMLALYLRHSAQIDFLAKHAKISHLLGALALIANTEGFYTHQLVASPTGGVMFLANTQVADDYAQNWLRNANNIAERRVQYYIYTNPTINDEKQRIYVRAGIALSTRLALSKKPDDADLAHIVQEFEAWARKAPDQLLKFIYHYSVLFTLSLKPDLHLIDVSKLIEHTFASAQTVKKSTQQTPEMVFRALQIAMCHPQQEALIKIPANANALASLKGTVYADHLLAYKNLRPKTPCPSHTLTASKPTVELEASAKVPKP